MKKSAQICPPQPEPMPVEIRQKGSAKSGSGSKGQKIPAGNGPECRVRVSLTAAVLARAMPDPFRFISRPLHDRGA
jgi:hypothetical protein